MGEQKERPEIEIKYLRKEIKPQFAVTSSSMSGPSTSTDAKKRPNFPGGSSGGSKEVSSLKGDIDARIHGSKTRSKDPEGKREPWHSSTGSNQIDNDCILCKEGIEDITARMKLPKIGAVDETKMRHQRPRTKDVNSDPGYGTKDGGNVARRRWQKVGSVDVADDRRFGEVGNAQGARRRAGELGGRDEVASQRKTWRSKGGAADAKILGAGLRREDDAAAGSGIRGIGAERIRDEGELDDGRTDLGTSAGRSGARRADEGMDPGGPNVQAGNERVGVEGVPPGRTNAEELDTRLADRNRTDFAGPYSDPRPGRTFPRSTSWQPENRSIVKGNVQSEVQRKVDAALTHGALADDHTEERQHLVAPEGERGHFQVKDIPDFPGKRYPGTGRSDVIGEHEFITDHLTDDISLQKRGNMLGPIDSDLKELIKPVNMDTAGELADHPYTVGRAEAGSEDRADIQSPINGADPGRYGRKKNDVNSGAEDQIAGSNSTNPGIPSSGLSTVDGAMARSSGTRDSHIEPSPLSDEVQASPGDIPGGTSLPNNVPIGARTRTSFSGSAPEAGTRSPRPVELDEEIDLQSSKEEAKHTDEVHRSTLRSTRNETGRRASTSKGTGRSTRLSASQGNKHPASQRNEHPASSDDNNLPRRRTSHSADTSSLGNVVDTAARLSLLAGTKIADAFRRTSLLVNGSIGAGTRTSSHDIAVSTRDTVFPGKSNPEDVSDTSPEINGDNITRYTSLPKSRMEVAGRQYTSGMGKKIPSLLRGPELLETSGGPTIPASPAKNIGVSPLQGDPSARTSLPKSSGDTNESPLEGNGSSPGSIPGPGGRTSLQQGHALPPSRASLLKSRSGRSSLRNSIAAAIGRTSLIKNVIDPKGRTSRRNSVAGTLQGAGRSSRSEAPVVPLEKIAEEPGTGGYFKEPGTFPDVQLRYEATKDKVAEEKCTKECACMIEKGLRMIKEEAKKVDELLLGLTLKKGRCEFTPSEDQKKKFLDSVKENSDVCFVIAQELKSQRHEINDMAKLFNASTCQFSQLELIVAREYAKIEETKEKMTSLVELLGKLEKESTIRHEMFLEDRVARRRKEEEAEKLFEEDMRFIHKVDEDRKRSLKAEEDRLFELQRQREKDRAMLKSIARQVEEVEEVKRLIERSKPEDASKGEGKDKRRGPPHPAASPGPRDPLSQGQDSLSSEGVEVCGLPGSRVPCVSNAPNFPHGMIILEGVLEPAGVLPGCRRLAPGANNSRRPCFLTRSSFLPARTSRRCSRMRRVRGLRRCLGSSGTRNLEQNFPVTCPDHDWSQDASMARNYRYGPQNPHFTGSESFGRCSSDGTSQRPSQESDDVLQQDNFSTPGTSADPYRKASSESRDAPGCRHNAPECRHTAPECRFRGGAGESRSPEPYKKSRKISELCRPKKRRNFRRASSPTRSYPGNSIRVPKSRR